MVEVNIERLRELIRIEKKKKALKSEVSRKKRVNILAKVEDKIEPIFIK